MTSSPAGRPIWVLKVAGSLLLALVLAASWMVFSMLAGKAGLGQAVSAASSGQAALAQAVTRSGVSGDGSKIQVLFATPEWYERTGQMEMAAEVDPEKYMVFIVTETDHNALAPAPVPALMADGRHLMVPVKDRLLSDSDHHRTRLLRYPRTSPNGESYIPEGTRSLEMHWPGMGMQHNADHTVGNPLRWSLPVALPSEKVTQGPVTPMSFLLLTSGLFAALSPCLIQLTLYYLSTLAGTTSTPGADRRKILPVALMFTAGISAAYTLGGVMAGYIGRAVQVTDVLGKYGKWIAIGSGSFIVVMGIYAVLQSEAPIVCRMHLPGQSLMKRWQTGRFAPFLMGFLMSMGCLQCFGGALFASLLVYVGSLSSPGLGGLMLFLFSLGVALPFLAAALAWKRISEWLSQAQRWVQTISLVSGVLMMTFGILMVIDKFHWVSGVLIRWLPFLQS